MIMKFLFERAPSDAQVIVAAEKLPPNLSVRVVDISHRRDKVLREALYDEVAQQIEQYVELQ